MFFPMPPAGGRARRFVLAGSLLLSAAPAALGQGSSSRGVETVTVTAERRQLPGTALTSSQGGGGE